MTLVENKLLEEDEKHKKRQAVEDTVLKTTNKFKPNNNLKKIVCHYCRGVGHIRRDCWKLKNNKSNSNQNAKIAETDKACDNFCFLLNGKAGVWVIDSGATYHICSTKEDFLDLDLNWREKVTVANGNVVYSAGKGSCKLKLVNAKGAEVVVTVDDVLYIPKFNGNLLSVKRLSAVGFKVLFCGLSCKIFDVNNNEVGVVKCVDNLYQIKTQCEEALLAICNLNQCQHFYHKIFGHRDINAVKAMQMGKLKNDFKIVDCKIREICSVCSKCKLSRKPFSKKSESKSGEVLDLIHSDICGPMQTVTPGGTRYFLTLIDDYSRYTVVYLLNQKSEVFDKLKIYINMVKNKFGKVPKSIMSDNGAEYKSNKVIDLLQSYGIKSQFSVPYCPQQNGVAERKNRYLVEMARCLLEEAGLPNIYWGEAIMCSNYLQNRLVTSSTPCTPYERWEEQKPDIGNFKIFGSKAYVLTPKVKRRKFDNKSELLTFMGYVKWFTFC